MNNQMKAAVLYAKEDMRIEQRDIPQIGDNELLIAVKACSICGSDLSYYYGHSPLETPDGKGPLVLGHEISGEVVAMGAVPQKAKLFASGDRVVINPVQQCNACEYCLRGEFNCCEHVETIGTRVDGGMAEFVKVKYTHAYKIPDSISFEQGALAEPLACATYGINRLDIELGQDVVIFGPGPIGLMMTQLAKASGAGRVVMVGVEDFGLKTALQLGADVVINTVDSNSSYYSNDLVQTIRQKLGRLAARAIVPTNAMTALQQAIEVTGKNSTIVYFGLPGAEDTLQIPMLQAIMANRTFKCSWLAPLVWDNVFNLIASGQIDTSLLITHRFTLDEAEQAIRFMKESKAPKIKAVIKVAE